MPGALPGGREDPEIGKQAAEVAGGGRRIGKDLSKGKKGRKREAIRLNRIERARLHQAQLRKEQRSGARDRRRQPEVPGDSAVREAQASERVRLAGKQLVEYCCSEYLANLPETSICLRAGYKIEEIGTFRRAFARAAGVDFGPLARMVLDLSQYSSPAPPELPIDSPAERQTREVRTVLKVRSSRFREAVLKQHGEECVCCSIRIKELLEAAHIVPVAWDGSDQPANGLPLCPTHHSAFDRDLFAYIPGSRELIFREGISSTELMITKDRLIVDVSDEALALRLRLFKKVSGTSAE
jgi:hypothetical protein